MVVQPVLQIPCFSELLNRFRADKISIHCCDPPLAVALRPRLAINAPLNYHARCDKR